MTVPPEITKTIAIKATPERVWEALTDMALMQQWMAEPDFDLEIITDWRVGSPITIKGFHHEFFVNKGTVLRFEPYQVLKYNYLSSLSHLPEEPQYFTSIKFRLIPVQGQTQLTITLRNFPTFEIFKHLDFYWNGTLVVLKNWLEKNK
jgi:uncharacterized protein YndB with AHSA1/START domain